MTKIEPNRVHFEYLPDAATSSICPPDSHHVRRTGSDSVNFDYLIYALGSKLPRPINIWDETEIVSCGSDRESADFDVMIFSESGLAPSLKAATGTAPSKSVFVMRSLF